MDRGKYESTKKLQIVIDHEDKIGDFFIKTKRTSNLYDLW